MSYRKYKNNSKAILNLTYLLKPKQMILKTEIITYHQLSLLYGDPSISMSAPFVSPGLVGAALGFIDEKAKQIRLYCIEEDESENSIHIWDLPKNWKHTTIECFETLALDSNSNESGTNNTNVIIKLSIEEVDSIWSIRETALSLHCAAIDSSVLK